MNGMEFTRACQYYCSVRRRRRRGGRCDTVENVYTVLRDERKYRVIAQGRARSASHGASRVYGGGGCLRNSGGPRRRRRAGVAVPRAVVVGGPTAGSGAVGTHARTHAHTQTQIYGARPRVDNNRGTAKPVGHATAAPNPLLAFIRPTPRPIRRPRRDRFSRPLASLRPPWPTAGPVRVFTPVRRSRACDGGPVERRAGR